MNKFLSFLAFVILFSLFSSDISAQFGEGWEYKKETEGVKVWIRTPKNSSFKEVLVKTSYNASMSTLVAVGMDISSYNKWVYASKEAKLLEKISEQEVIYYSESEVPWPFENRDIILRSTVKQDPDTKIVNIYSDRVTDYMPKKDGIVRVPDFVAQWVLTPQEDGSIEATYYIKTDPGGVVPAWLMNVFVDKGPVESFGGLRKLSKQEPYKSLNLDYIID